MDRILLVTDSKEIQTEVQALLGQRYELDYAATGKSAAEKAEARPYDLVLVEAHLSDIDGFQLCTQFRNQKMAQTLPILLIADVNEYSEQSRAAAFSAGANDLIQRPFKVHEFCAQVSLKIYYRRVISKRSNRIIFGPFEVDLEAQKAFVKVNSKVEDLELTPIEFKMLVLFLNHDSQVLARDKIRVTVWGENIHIESRSIDKHVSSLRKKISPYSHLIRTAPGIGYTMTLDESKTV
ncbi:MAG: response regulator transcription factor [Bdellovibrionales bacterium]